MTDRQVQVCRSAEGSSSSTAAIISLEAAISRESPLLAPWMIEDHIVKSKVGIENRKRDVFDTHKLRYVFLQKCAGVARGEIT